MLCTPLLLDTHAIAPPVGAAMRSVGNGAAMSVSIDSACRASGVVVITATAASVRTRRKVVFMMVRMLAQSAVEFPAMTTLKRALVAALLIVTLTSVFAHAPAVALAQAGRTIDLDAATIADV